MQDTHKATGAHFLSLASVADSVVQPYGSITREQDLHENLARIERRAASVHYSTENTVETEGLRDTLEVVRFNPMNSSKKLAHIQSVIVEGNATEDFNEINFSGDNHDNTQPLLPAVVFNRESSRINDTSKLTALNPSTHNSVDDLTTIRSTSPPLSKSASPKEVEKLH